MSRIANNPVSLPSGVEVKLDGQRISIKGGKGTLEMDVHADVEVQQADNELTFAARSKSKQARALSGTTRALVNNMVRGVTMDLKARCSSGRGLSRSGTGQEAQPAAGFLPPGRVSTPGGCDAETPEPDGDRAFRDGQAAGGPGVRGDPRVPATRALQRQGCALSDERVRRKEAKKK